LRSYGLAVKTLKHKITGIEHQELKPTV
jgi:hypothetical protein